MGLGTSYMLMGICRLVLGSEICNKGKGAMFGEMGMSILENGEKGL